METVLTDAVYTPSRAHFRWGKDLECPHCYGAACNWQHLVDGCPHTPKREPPESYSPPCLRYAGNVPAGFNPAPHSREMGLMPPSGPYAPVVSTQVLLVATDGGCEGDSPYARAGWG